jgi:hypothetical protein
VGFGEGGPDGADCYCFHDFARRFCGAHAEKRVALVIGNSAYKHSPELTNPRNDAEDFAAAVKALGIGVVVFEMMASVFQTNLISPSDAVNCRTVQNGLSPAYKLRRITIVTVREGGPQPFEE